MDNICYENTENWPGAAVENIEFHGKLWMNHKPNNELNLKALFNDRSFVVKLNTFYIMGAVFPKMDIFFKGNMSCSFRDGQSF